MIDDFSSSIYWNDLKTLCKPDHDFYTAVLSTINEVKPSSRIIVIREIQLDLNKLIFYTDFRSEKVKQLKQNPNCQLLFYNRESRYQLILSCKANLEEDSDVVDGHWQNIGRKDAYQTLDAPGTVLESLTSAAIIDPELADGGKDNFAVFACMIEQINVLQIGSPNKRYRFILKDGEWQSLNLVP